MKATYLYRLFACVICIAILLTGCHEPTEPDTTGEISDIRMYVAPYVDEDTMSSDTTFLRIYYGYYKNGKWFDYPSEHYELKSIFTPKQYSGYDAAFEDHIVKIGPYLLISISDYTFLNNGELVPVEITDTLGSEVQQMFSEYYSSLDNGQPYGYIKEDRPGSNPFFSDPDDFAINLFGQYYYVVLEYDALPNDYALQYTTLEKGEKITHTLTYEQIKQLIEG